MIGAEETVFSASVCLNLGSLKHFLPCYYQTLKVLKLQNPSDDFSLLNGFLF